MKAATLLFQEEQIAQAILYQKISHQTVLFRELGIL